MTKRQLIPPIDACLIDLDGTLVDTVGDFEAALNRMLAELQLPPVAPEFIARTVGQGSEHLIRSVLAEQRRLADAPAAPPDADYERAWRAYQRHYHDINGRFSRVYPGVPAGLAQLRARSLPLACVTNKPLAFARALLVAKGLDGHFAHVFGGDNFARKKPDPLPLIEACRALGTPPARTLMVGDSRNDAQAAHAAGCPVVLMTYGYNHGESVAHVQAHAHLASLTELATWLADAAAPARGLGA